VSARVVWIGGGTGGGKTTAARLLAARYGLRVYPIDAFWYAHDARLRKPELDPDAQWLHRTPEQQAAQFEETSRRRLPLVLEDLEALPREPAIVVEGPQVVPDALPSGAVAVFLVPEAAFQRSILSQREMPPTSDPARALANRIEKDRLYAQRVEKLARACAFPVIRVDGSRPAAEIAADVDVLLGPSLPEPTGIGFADARRWKNGVVAQNVRSWLASRQAPAESEGLAYPFECECGTLGCTERVTLTLDEFQAAECVVAPGH
jgi:hypothetical protein